MTPYDLLAALCYVLAAGLAVFVAFMFLAAVVERVVIWLREWWAER